jgi:DNA replication protein DnaC
MQNNQNTTFPTSTTGNSSLDFPVPGSVLDDLETCYRREVENFGSTYSRDANVTGILHHLASWMQHDRPGLILMGGVGTGKTRVLKALSALIGEYSARSGGRQSLRVIGAVEACKLAADNDPALGRLKTFRYLGIDDLGTEPVDVKVYGTEVSPIIEALHDRYDRRAVTVISTNENLDRIRQRYGERIHDRIIEQYSIVPFNFNSFRKR